MQKLDLSVLGDIVHERCNAQFYSEILHFFQIESEKLEVTFSQKKSIFTINELPNSIAEKLIFIMIVARFNFLYKDIELDTFLKWVMDDLHNGYGYKFLCSVIKALEEEKVFIHFSSNQNINDEYPTDKFIADLGFRAGVIRADDYLIH